jgi:HAD superfamily hydrolase (TIGR01459 family)
MEYLQSLANITPLYDAYLFDVYGVLHNGKEPYFGARDCLKQLALMEKHAIILTNAPQSIPKTIAKIEKFGFTPALYQSIMTAGHLTHQFLVERIDPWHARLGDHCYIIGTALDEEILIGTGIHKVHTVEEADFLLVLGADEWHHTLEDYTETLDAALIQKLPMICANPDMVVFSGENQELRAGMLAEYYRNHGGRVFSHGKPYPQIYQRALQMLPEEIPLTRIVAVGDSFHTDYKGAQNIGIDFVLCFGRLSAYELQLDWDTAKNLSYEKLIQIITEAGYNPQYVVFEELVW